MTEQCNHPVYDGAGWNAWPCNQPKGHGGFHGILSWGVITEEQAEAWVDENFTRNPDGSLTSPNVHGADACAWGGNCGCERRAKMARRKCDCVCEIHG